MLFRSGGAGGRSGRIAQRQGKAPAMVPADGVTGCVLGCYDNAPPPYMLSVDPLLAIENVAEYRNIVTVLWESLATGDVALPEQVDAVFTAYGYNALRGREVKDMNALAKSVFLDLKPGGVFVVVDNAAAANSGFNDVATLGRADVAAVKKEILAAGYDFDSIVAQRKALGVVEEEEATV